MIRQLNIRYFDPYRMHGCLCKENDCYDTGASFYEDCMKNKYPVKIIDYNNYIFHLDGGSWLKNFNSIAYNIKIQNFIKQIGIK